MMRKSSYIFQCEGTSHLNPRVHLSESQPINTPGAKPGRCFKKMHEEEHHQQMSILQLQLIQMNEVHVAKIQQIERECEMADRGGTQHKNGSSQ